MDDHMIILILSWCFWIAMVLLLAVLLQAWIPVWWLRWKKWRKKNRGT